MKVKNLQKILVALFLKVMMLAKRKILNKFQMKVKNLHKPLIALIQNVMMLNFSLQVKKKI
jgi:hypothetical protein